MPCFGGAEKKYRSKTFLLYTDGWSPPAWIPSRLDYILLRQRDPPLPAFSLRNREHWVQCSWPTPLVICTRTWAPKTFLLFSLKKRDCSFLPRMTWAHSHSSSSLKLPHASSGACHMNFLVVLPSGSPFHVTFSIILLGFSYLLSISVGVTSLWYQHTRPQRARRSISHSCSHLHEMYSWATHLKISTGELIPAL